MKKNTFRTAAVGTFLGLSLVLGLGIGTTVLNAAVSSPASEQSQICDKPAACPLQDTSACPIEAGKTAKTSASAQCPHNNSGSKI